MRPDGKLGIAGRSLDNAASPCFQPSEQFTDVRNFHTFVFACIKAASLQQVGFRSAYRRRADMGAINPTHALLQCRTCMFHATKVSEPRLVAGLKGNKVASVATGGHHSLAVTAEGELYTWGSNAYGALGLGPRPRLSPTPALVQSLWGVPIASVAAGTYHSGCVDRHGCMPKPPP